jgi:hypothetical protein
VNLKVEAGGVVSQPTLLFLPARLKAFSTLGLKILANMVSITMLMCLGRIILDQTHEDIFMKHQV